MSGIPDVNIIVSGIDRLEGLLQLTYHWVSRFVGLPLYIE